MSNLVRILCSLIGIEPDYNGICMIFLRKIDLMLYKRKYVAEAGSSNFGTASKFSASNIRLSYLSARDSFKYSDRSITSSKTRLIGSSTGAVQFSGHLDSANIFVVDAQGVGATSTTFKRMIDQTDSSNLGTALADAAHNDPLSFVLTFKKDATTQGYKNATGTYNGPYTIKKALVDVR